MGAPVHAVADRAVERREERVGSNIGFQEKTGAARRQAQPSADDGPSRAARAFNRSGPSIATPARWG